MSAVLDLDQAREAAVREHELRALLDGPDGPLVRALVDDQRGMRFTRGDQQGDVYRTDLPHGVDGYAVTGRTGADR